MRSLYARRKQTIDGSLPIIAKAIGGKMDVRVHVGGKNAYTDGRVVHIPFGDPDDPAYRTLAVGYTIHEGAHIKHTDFEAKAALAERPVALAIYRCLEDVRIERAVIRELPGTARYLQALCQVLIERGGAFEAVCEETPPHQKLAAYLLYRLRHDVLEQSAFMALADQAGRAVKAAFPPGAITRLTALMFQVTEAATTGDVVRLAARITAMLEEEAREASPSADGQQESAARMDPAPMEPDPTPTTATRKDDAKSPADGAAGRASDAERDEAACDPAERTDAKRALREALEADWSDVPTDTGDLVGRLLETDAAQAPNGDFAGMAEPDDPGLPLGDPDALVRECEAACNALSTRLVNLVEAIRTVETRACRAGELDADALHEVVFANARLFVEEEQREGIDTAVQILLDRSGSMRRRIGLARQATLATALALARLADVQVAAAAFPGVGGVVPLTRFGESTRRTTVRYTLEASGGTPMAEAIWLAAAELEAATAERKILLVVTDGEPADGAMTTDVVDRCVGSGFEVCAIAIGTEGATRYFPNCTRIDAIEELAPTMFRMLEPMLLRAQRVVA